jgi:hypothetical protein
MITVSPSTWPMMSVVPVRATIARAREHLAALGVDAERLGGSVKASRPQIAQQRVHRWRPGPRRTADRISDADYADADVPARQRLLIRHDVDRPPL